MKTIRRKSIIGRCSEQGKHYLDEMGRDSSSNLIRSGRRHLGTRHQRVTISVVILLNLAKVDSCGGQRTSQTGLGHEHVSLEVITMVLLSEECM